MNRELAELARNCSGKREQLANLFAAFDLAELGDKMQNERIHNIYDETLRENEFYAENGSPRFGIEKGGRVLSHDADFLLSEADFSRLLVLAGVKLTEAGICDKDGYYTTNWTLRKIDARNALVDFIIGEILPENFRGVFSANRQNITQMDKLIKITRPIIAA